MELVYQNFPLWCERFLWITQSIYYRKLHSLSNRAHLPWQGASIVLFSDYYKALRGIIKYKYAAAIGDTATSTITKANTAANTNVYAYFCYITFVSLVKYT